MIEALKDFPDNVIAIACHGHVTKADYETVLIPDLEDKLGRHERVRIYCEIAPDYVGLDPGAVWEDTKVGFSHLRDWDRAAMVTDVEWMRHVAKFFGGFFGFLVSGEWRAFPIADADKAREWIVGRREPGGKRDQPVALDARHLAERPHMRLAEAPAIEDHPIAGLKAGGVVQLGPSVQQRSFARSVSTAAEI